jgi:homoserine kinase type II
MAVFTPITVAELASWFAEFNVGTLKEIQGIQSGIENSNFFAITDRGTRYVLTIFERLTFDELPFYLNMMRHMAGEKVACPDPLTNRSGALLHQLKEKPAALVTCLNGQANMHPSAIHCAAVGDVLAKMHLAANTYGGTLPNLRGLSWWQITAPKVLNFLNSEQQAMLNDEMTVQSAFAMSPDYARLQRGAVHADLFRDNVLFDGHALGGVIDFYFAGVDTYLFDLAVTINDWCIDDATGEIEPNRYKAMLDAYASRRALSAQERTAWPMMLRAAALRFWLSRLYDFYLPREAAMLTPKDPTHFERILKLRRQNNLELPHAN